MMRLILSLTLLVTALTARREDERHKDVGQLRRRPSRASICRHNPFLGPCSSLEPPREGLLDDPATPLAEGLVPARGRAERLVRRFHYLHYLRLVYNKLKREYAREYYGTRGGPLSLPEFGGDSLDYTDYGDYGGLGVPFGRQLEKYEDFSA